MAVKLTDEFGNRANPSSAAYPNGSLKDETNPGVSNDGSPLSSRVGNDFQGFMQSALAEAGVDANGNPDSVTNPQILNAIKSITDDRFNYDGLVYEGVGNISAFAGQQLQAADKTNAYQYPDDSRQFYAADKSQSFPITIPADPSSDNGWALVNAITDGVIRQYTDPLIGASSFPTDGSISIGDSVPAGTTHIWAQGSIYPIYAKDGSGNTESPSGTVSALDLVGVVPSITIGADEFWLLDIKWFKGLPSYRSFWAKGNAQGLVSDVSDYESMQACTDSVPTGGVIHKESGRYATHRKVYMGARSRVTVKGDGKFSTEIIPTSTFDETTDDCLIEYGDGTNNSNNITLQDFAAQAVYNAFGNDLSGCAVNVGYNLDIINCQFKSGNPVTRPTAGLRIRSGKHTKIYHSNFHNGFGYGMLIDLHNVDLLIGEGNAFDETPSAIVSAGNILEMVVNSTSFGNCIPNPTNPTAADGITIDLRVGNHGVVKITNDNTMKGSSFNKFGVRYNSISVCDISGNTLSNFARYAIASEGNSSEDFSDNIFQGNGTEGASSDPSTGTNNPETSPFTCDIFKLRAEVGGSKVCGNITDITTKPFAWVRGDASSPYTTSLQVNSNNSDAYVHGKTYSKLRDFKNGYQDLQALPPYERTISGFTVASGGEESSNVTGITGAEPGDTVVINAKSGGLSPFLTLRGTCTTANIVRWYVTNPSVDSVAQASFDVTIQVTKN